MKSPIVRAMFCAVAAVPLMTLAQTSSADDPRMYMVEGGVAIYFGIMPGEMTLGHPKGHVEREMHGGAPSRKRRDHVVVALFDNGTGVRITDAQVTATVREIGLAGQTKTLDPMKIAETVTYGNYFDLPRKDPYRVVLEIRRPGAAGPLTAEFTHQH